MWINYSDLIVWQKAMDLTDEVYRLLRLLPKEEMFGLTSQMRRAVVSIPSNIAEGQGRQTQKEFKHFLSIAQGSLFELQTQIEICVRQNYFTKEIAKPVLTLSNEVGKLLTSIIVKL